MPTNNHHHTTSLSSFFDNFKTALNKALWDLYRKIMPTKLHSQLQCTQNTSTPTNQHSNDDNLIWTNNNQSIELDKIFDILEFLTTTQTNPE